MIALPPLLAWASLAAFLRDGFVSVMAVFFSAAFLYLLFFNLYHIIISFFGIVRKRERKIYTPSTRFALLVPAHNEEIVIGETVRSMLLLDYPRELYDVIVVADNCTDRTAEVARAAGATVLERFNESERGKPYAVDWALRQILESPRDYGAVCVFDADNLVSRNYLLEMNSRILQGEKVIQGYIDAKNPNDSWITWMYAISFWTAARSYQLPRYQLGLANLLGGTGYCITTDVLKVYGWEVTALADDLEYTMRVLLDGIRPTWAHDAKVYDEKPLNMKASWRQRLRWMQGHWDVAFRYTIPLLKRGIKTRDYRCIDGALYCLSPTRAMLWGSTLVLSWVPWIFPEVYRLTPNPGPWLGMGVVALYWGWPMVEMALERVPPIYFLRYLALMFIFSLTWIPLAWLGFLRRHLKHWDKTEHTRAISITEIERR